MNAPFLSLITPVYNIERLLPKTIESALSQTFTDWEMILVDDGSPDNAGKICDDYAKRDKRIRVVHKDNAGLAAARNTGMRECTGKYFMIFEGSDILFDEKTLENICNTLEDTDYDIYFARLQDMLEDGFKVTDVQKPYCVKGEFIGGKELFIKLYDNEDILALSSPVNKVFCTEFIKSNNLWFYEGIYHDDDEWLPRTISLSNKSYFTDDIIYNAMTWDGCFGGNVSDKGLTKKACDKMLIAHHCLEDIDERFPENNTEFKKKYYEYYVRMYLDGIAVLNRVEDVHYVKQINESIKKHQKVFIYALRCTSRNLRYLSAAKRLFGLNTAKRLVMKRYSK